MINCSRYEPREISDSDKYTSTPKSGLIAGGGLAHMSSSLTEFTCEAVVYARSVSFHFGKYPELFEALTTQLHAHAND